MVRSRLRCFNQKKKINSWLQKGTCESAIFATTSQYQTPQRLQSYEKGGQKYSSMFVRRMSNDVQYAGQTASYNGERPRRVANVRTQRTCLCSSAHAAAYAASTHERTPHKQLLQLRRSNACCSAASATMQCNGLDACGPPQLIFPI